MRSMWKKLLCGVLAAATLSGSAGAYTLEADGYTINPNEETRQFWESYKYPLNEQGIYERSADGWNFCVEFHDGLLLVNDGTTPSPYGYWDNYVDQNGALHDLNRGRYRSMYSFSGGYAAVLAVNPSGIGVGVGFVDTQGNEVIPPNPEYQPLTADGVYTGRFENGRAVVIRVPEKVPGWTEWLTQGHNPGVMTTIYDENDWYGFEYAYIDPRGNLLTDWTLIQDWDEVLKMPLYDQDGVWIGHRWNWTAAGDHPIQPGETQPPVEDPEKTQPPAERPAEEEKPQIEATYGQSTVVFQGYTIDENNVGQLLIQVTNNGDDPDEGDLFYLLYSKYLQGSEIIDAGRYVPDDLILQIRYQVEAHSTTTLSIPVGKLGNWDVGLTQAQVAAGWHSDENVASSRVVLAQAESPEEAQELAAFFRAIHDYGEMQLSATPDSNGVIELAKPFPNAARAEYLDQKLSAFTSQF